MTTFKGFTDSETFTQLPDSFFHHLLNEITDADELKVTLYALWLIEHMDGPFRALSQADFDAKDLGLAADEIASGLAKAVQRGSLLNVQKDALFYFLLNSPRGRAALQAMERGKWNPKVGGAIVPVERPNVFKLYEENIGPLAPLIADALKDAEKTYSEEWVADAISEAVQNNARSWKYIDVILKNWKRDGRAEKQNRRDDKKSRQRNVEDKIKKFTGG